MVITIKTDDNKTYETSSLISGFALGGLLELGIKDKKELEELSEIIKEVYIKGEGLDIGNITDYVYNNRNTIRELATRDIIEKIVEAQW